MKKPEKKYGARADLGAPVGPWVKKLAPGQRAIVQKLRAIVRSAAPGVEESIKWGMPVFSKNGYVCYAKPSKGYVRFGFYQQGAKLEDPDGVLEGAGSMKHVKLASVDDIKPALFKKWVKRAVAINAGAK